ncbi:MAG: phosphoribosylaminoimidazolesuccinocarboxamide synthase [Alphaproteobacteria bacterium]|nr:phosphoribosylaminoimidazolesuccinocarboxamide synthase [Alphaproteobacteria bacterium]MDA7983482.1 phosphoribosylaminoimidazolesuccinocarboxamide synthase [Alphaproteobacteria bacterium]
MISRRRPIYEDHARAIFHGPEGRTLVQHFKDGARAGGGRVVDVEGKGALSNRISERLMRGLATAAVPTHFIRRLNMREQLVGDCDNFPFSVRVYNAACDDFHSRFGMERNQPLPRAVLEYVMLEPYGERVSEEHITAFDWAASHEVEEIFHLALRVNDVLLGMCAAVGMRMLRAELSFARSTEEEMSRVVLADALTPDGCLFCDLRGGDLLGLPGGDGEEPDEEALGGMYREVARRFGVLEETEGEVLEEDVRTPVAGARIYSFTRRARKKLTSVPPPSPPSPSPTPPPKTN